MRFVLLHHTGWPGRADHYDLMLECQAGSEENDRTLLTFATQDDAAPCGDPPALLTLIETHRRAYLQFEGVLSGGRGRVDRADCGALQWIQPPSSGTHLHVALSGSMLNGLFVLEQIEHNTCLFKKQ